jgi:hypothetical protein
MRESCESELATDGPGFPGCERGARLSEAGAKITATGRGDGRRSDVEGPW